MTSMHCFLELIRKELYLFKQAFLSNFIDVCVMATTNTVVYGYFMSKMGLNSTYGFFILIGAVSTFALFMTIGKASGMAQDIEDKKIANLLILPIKSQAVFASQAIAWAIGGSILSLCLIPLGKLILWNSFDLSQLSLYKFGLIFLTGNLFYGFFALWIASWITDLRYISWLWCRVINPLFMFCGYFYTWKAVCEVSPVLGALHLLNPLLYVLEGTKAAVLGQTGFLPFWVCFFALWGFMGLFGAHAIYRLKKRLDCV